MTEEIDLSLKIKIMKIPELEACLNKQVRIVRSTPRGEESLDARIIEMGIPWQMYIEFSEDHKDGQFIAFAGAHGGIMRIERDGKIVYENKKIPVPYPELSTLNAEQTDALNGLRKECFGEGYDYARLCCFD